MKFKYTDKLLIVLIALFSIFFTLVAIFSVKQTNSVIDDSININIKNVALLVAADKEVQTLLANKDSRIDEHIDEYFDSIESVEYIVVIDQESIRYSHSDKTKIGKSFVGGDQMNAIDNGETYISTGLGTLGYSRRAFVPIYKDSVQVGVVAVGSLQSHITDMKTTQNIIILFGYGIGLLISLTALFFFSRNIKKSLLGFEPSEIAMLYSENKSIIEQLNQGVISIDQDFKITTINKTAQEMLKLCDEDKSKDAKDILPEINFNKTITFNKAYYNQLTKINDETLLVSCFPLYKNDKIIGATAIFKSRLEVDMLLDQITGYRKISKTLREQKHEFQNKLHVILGLIKMNDIETVTNYITSTVYTTNLVSDNYSSRIKDDKLSALFVGKDIQSKEYNTNIILASNSYISEHHYPINSDDLIIIIGNLIDNAFDAYKSANIENGKIHVFIKEYDESILIRVSDNAGGVEPSIKAKMFLRGVSTKDGSSRGTGLSLVAEIIRLYSGKKKVISTKEETVIEIKLSKVKI